MIRLALVIPLLALAACKTENPAFCANPANAGREGCSDGSSGGSCGSNADCVMPEFPVCEVLLGGACKACSATNRGACKGNTPHCENNACVACVDDENDCSGGVCLLDGSCAASNTIIHVVFGSVKMSACGESTLNPCSLPGALMLAMPGKNIVKIDGGGTFIGNGFNIPNDVTIDARGAILGRTGGGAILTIAAGKTATLLGGTVSGIPGGAEGIKCTDATLTMAETRVELNDQAGVNASNCMLDFRRVAIINNSQKANTYKAGIEVDDGSIELSRSRLEGNNGGGLNINAATFKIVGNVFFNNGPMGTGGGDPPSAVGGVFINTTFNAANRLEFNTIVGNHAQPSFGPGLGCNAGNLSVRNNIVWNNNENGMKQFAGGCQLSYSNLGFETTDVNNNLHVDPMLTGDQHLMMNSPMLDKADPASNLDPPADRDIDGQRRVIRTGALGADIGADQYYPGAP